MAVQPGTGAPRGAATARAHVVAEACAKATEAVVVICLSFAGRYAPCIEVSPHNLREGVPRARCAPPALKTPRSGAWLQQNSLSLHGRVQPRNGVKNRLF
jgi:hypothetical protein